jgi:hypothetical protein
MARKNEEAGSMRKQNPRRTSGGDHHPTLQHRLFRGEILRPGMMLCLVLLTLHALSMCALGQQNVPKIVRFDVEKPLNEPLKYQFSGKEPLAENELEFNGNGRWSFIYFDKLPGNTSLRTKDQPAGYEDSEVLKEETWYWFKNKLPLVLEIKSGAVPPVNISFWYGSPKIDGEKERANQMDSTQIRDFTRTKEFKQDPVKQALELTWTAAPGPTSTSSQTPTAPTPTPIPAPEVSWMRYLTEEHPEVGFIFLIVGVFLFVLSVLLVSKLMKRPRGLRSRRSSRLTPPRSSPLDSLASDSSKSSAQERHAYPQTPNEGKLKKTIYNSDKDRGGKNQFLEERSPRHEPGDVIMPPPKTSSAASSNQPAPFSQPAAPSFKAEANRLEDLIKSEVAQLRTILAQKADHQDQADILAGAKRELVGEVKRAQQETASALKELEKIVLEQASLMDQARTELTGQVREADQRGAQAKERLENLLKEVLAESRKAEPLLEARLSKLRDALKLQTVPDSFFNKTLGLVLGQNIETLQDGNFEQLIGEKLNQFFETGVEHGEELQELRARAEGINSALKDVSIQMEKLNAQASVEALQPMQRVDAFVNELRGLQSEMQTRRATIETVLHVPVSMHAGARQTFLDELGRGIRREIDKLNDPQSYFEGQLERLVTADLIAIVDICDKKVGPPPGSRPDLEAVLKRLFEQAGLRHILPSQGEAFKTAEQDLIEMAQGAGKSLTVAQVITRGFFYKHRDNETLLRKAGVSVFR